MSGSPHVIAAAAAAAIGAAGCAGTPDTGELQLGEKEFTADDRVTLPVSIWEPAPGQSVRAVVIAVHGLSGAASDFQKLGKALPPRGVAVVAPALRGQGLDPEETRRGDIRRGRWGRDLIALTELVRAKYPEAPIIWYGESMGSLIALHTAARTPLEPPDGLVLASPVVSLGRDSLPRWKELALRLAIAGRPGQRISFEKLARERPGKVTSETTHEEEMKRTDHYLDTLTFRLLGEIGRMIRSAGSDAEQLGMPVLVLYTPQDIFSAVTDVDAFFNRIASPDKEKVLFENSYHLILHDIESRRAIQHVQNWIHRVADEG